MMRNILLVILGFLTVFHGRSSAGVVSFSQFDNQVRDGLNNINTPAVLAPGQTFQAKFSGQSVITSLDGVKTTYAEVSGKVIITNAPSGLAGSIRLTDLFYHTTYHSDIADPLFSVTFVVFLDQVFAFKGPGSISARDTLRGLFSFNDLGQQASLRVSAGVGTFPISIQPPLTAGAASTAKALQGSQNIPLSLQGGPDSFFVGNTVELVGTLRVTLKYDGVNGLNPDFEMFNNRSQYLEISYQAAPEPSTFVLFSLGLSGFLVWRKRLAP